MPKAKVVPIQAIAKLFHRPIEDASRILGVCATVIKKQCRRYGMALGASVVVVRVVVFSRRGLLMAGPLGFE